MYLVSEYRVWTLKSGGTYSYPYPIRKKQFFMKSVSHIALNGRMVMKGNGRKWQWHIPVIISASLWRNWGKSRYTSGRIAGLRTENKNGGFPNASRRSAGQTSAGLLKQGSGNVMCRSCYMQRLKMIQIAQPSWGVRMTTKETGLGCTAFGHNRTDEATLRLSGTVNRQSYVYWSSENPNIYVDKGADLPGFTFWWCVIQGYRGTVLPWRGSYWCGVSQHAWGVHYGCHSSAA